MKRKTVSLCMIARDEESTIGMTIKSVLALVDEVIVVDTGSRDNTRIIAEGYGARVLEIPWEDDFAAARNVALNEATGDWVLILDADEFLQPVRPVEFQRMLNEPGICGYRVRMISPSAEDHLAADNLVRLFMNNPEVRYRYPIYEQIVPNLTQWGQSQSLSISGSELMVMHEAARPERNSRRRERNSRILQKALISWPEEPYFPYKLACQGLSLLDEEVLPVSGIRTALGYLHSAWSKVRLMSTVAQKSLPWLPDLAAKTASALLAIDRVEEACNVTRQVRQVFSNHPQVLLQDIAANIRYLQANGKKMGAGEAVELSDSVRSDLEYLRSGLPKNQSATMDNRFSSLYPLRYLGELELLEGHVSIAVGLFEKALGIDPAFSFAWLGMAECSWFAGDRKRALKLYLRTVTENELNHRAWFRGSQLMEEMDFRDNASSWQNRVTILFPEHPLVSGSSELNHESEILSVTG